MPDVLPKIIIVNDDQEVVDLYVEKFRASGFEATGALGGEQGLQIAKQIKPDIIFTGIMKPHQTPQMTGFEMMKELQADPGTGKIPFIIFSHRGLEPDRQLANELGAGAFLVQGRTTPNEVVAVAQGILRGANYRVVINVDEFDGGRLSTDLKATGPIVLDLFKSPESPTTFTAKVANISSAKD
jgi:CheY-like chemotaxis protein